MSSISESNVVEQQVKTYLQQCSNLLDTLKCAIKHEHSVKMNDILNHLKSLSILRSKLIQMKFPPHVWAKYFLQHEVIKDYMIWAPKKVLSWSTEKIYQISIFNLFTSKDKKSELQETIILFRKIIIPIDLEILQSLEPKEELMKPEESFVSEIRKLYYANSSCPIINLERYNVIELFCIIEYLCSELINVHSPETGIAHNDSPAFKCISQHFEVYRNYMKKSKQKFEMLLLETLMLTLNYDVVSDKFGIVCCDELQYFIRQKQSVVAELNNQATTDEKFQAFLFKLAASIGMKYRNVACIIKTDLVLNHIEYMKQQLSNDLLPQIRDVLNAFENDYETIVQYLSGVDGEMKWNTMQALHIAISTSTKYNAKEELLCNKKGEDFNPRNSDSTLEIILNALKLREKYPQKITLKDALMIKPEDVALNNDLSKLPYVILHKIMACDHRSRSYLFPPVEDTDSSTDSDSNDDDFKTFKDMPVHPVDAILALLHCSDNFLRQVLLYKLSLCQISIPLLLPDTIENTVTLLLWAMHSVENTWEVVNSSGERCLRQCSIAEYNGPIISFVKFGNLKYSKSDILNKVIGKQDIFFHWNLESQESKKLISNGVLEVCCYCPSTDNAHFPNSIIFTNLHGDASEHKTQTTFVKKISFMSIILLSVELIKDNDESIKTILQEFTHLPGGAVILIDFKPNKIRHLIKSIDNVLIISIKNKPLAQIRDDIRSFIINELKHKHAYKSIADYIDVAHELKIIIDEEDKDCVQGKLRALGVMEHAKIKMSRSKSKYNILPLQGPDFWQKWVLHNKERYRHKLKPPHIPVIEYTHIQEEIRDKLRPAQLESGSSSFTIEFLANMLQCKQNERKYFLHWLKKYINQHLGDLLPNLQHQYQQVYAQIKEISSIQSVDTDEQNELKHQLNELSSMLLDVSFGLEHCFRELGQLFEAIEETQNQALIPQELRNSIKLLPQLAAETLIEGFPLEIMDGEASHIPITWVQAVINYLESIYGNKRIFILSILGVQSSGKSTLLNTLFGLQFKVSAGRCTRGVFIQLLQVDNSLKDELHCDFILTVDTEGIRAPELLNQDLEQHDNELATFVVGLADFTIVNIFGETPADLSDVLQTVLHAFIRMKKVEKNPSCIFVHQNVTEQFAKKKLTEGTQVLKSKLDNATRCVAKVEGCESKYTKFQDVINFDEDSDVHYFSGLWEGDPPMAPINFGYSQKAQKLKQVLLEVIKKQTYLCSFNGFKVRIKNMWEAILQETYLFSFRNVMEIFAYTQLDTQFGKWNSELQREFEMYVVECEYKIKSSVSENVKSTKDSCSKYYTGKLDEKYEKLSEDLHKFIESHDNSKILSKWSFSTDQKLKDMKDQHCTAIRNYCQKIANQKENDKEKEVVISQYEAKIHKDVIELATKNKSKLIPEDIEKIFNHSWEAWIHDINQSLHKDDAYPTDDTITADIENNITSKFKKERDVVAKVSECNINHMELKTFEGDLEKHVKFKADYCTSNESYKEQVAENKLKIISEMYINEAIKLLHEKLEKLNTYTPSIVEPILSLLIESIDKFNEDESEKFILTSGYKVDIACHICNKVSKRLKGWVKKNRHENDPLLSLQQQKSRFFIRFKNIYHNVEREKAAAIQLCHSLTIVITCAVCNNLKLKMIHDLQQSNKNFQSKRCFKVQILTDLTNEPFSSYDEYLTDCNDSFKKWTERYVKIHGQSKSGVSDETVFRRLANYQIDELINAIKAAANNSDICSISEWLDKFCLELNGKFEIKRTEWLNDISNIDNVTFFRGCLIQELNTIHETKVILDEIEVQFNQICKDAGDKLYDNIIGNTCTAQCPFCQEQCDLSNSSHYEKQKICHYVKIHRPQCTAKPYDVWKKPDNKIIDICNSLVASDQEFSYISRRKKSMSMRSTPKEKKFPLKEYKKVYKEWDISSDKTASPPDYWMWVVTHFYKDVVNWAGGITITIPEQWYTISKKKAINNLEKMYMF